MHRNRVAAARASAPPSRPSPPPAQDPDAWRDFGARLRHWRRRAGLTQAQLGAGIGYDHTAVSKIEHGARRVTPRIVDRIDELLGAGGDLRAACQRAETAELPSLAAFAPGLLRPPLPTAASGPGGPVRWTAPAQPPPRLPDYGLLCPLHGADGCDVPDPVELAALHAEFCAADPAAAPPLDAATAHALTGLLAAHLRSGETGGLPGLAAAVERTLQAVLARLAAASAEQRRPLARLAAEHAHAAGALRMQDGRNATAMACFDRALAWAELAGDQATQVAALSDMSTLARLDGDPAAAFGYAREIGRAAPGRHWSGAMGQIGQARALALTGDVRATIRHLGRARLHLDHIGARDEDDAPWLSIASMRLRVESGAAAALRDLAAVVDDPRLAQRALTAAETALDLLGPAQLPASRLLFTVRVADCHACAHDPRTAVELLGPTLETAPVEALPALVGYELRGLRDRLAAHRPDTARRLAELAGS
ncbi:DNA-binding XRE family transcriptional regulator/tetratricopeptide (TPR) repeat protein [Kitasatospora sp. MAA19]|uniref:helix-turn-helix transcriptional regulator n=1 Tax=Kitasatospora sp. MAA19 TaxID=3035090 RepID=UPI00247722A1|nr:helix-turn-helix transcriptional regulator [Kitasatospora sp. MAA19]MDH6710159.1 DNA-binding XRE family transcriptional regulator/tetratricopeptide (TPR) repeat protein [Kitasatospora sp. MAA19]